MKKKRYIIEQHEPHCYLQPRAKSRATCNIGQTKTKRKKTNKLSVHPFIPRNMKIKLPLKWNLIIFPYVRSNAIN
jgi:hypothetical protein